MVEQRGLCASFDLPSTLRRSRDETSSKKNTNVYQQTKGLVRNDHCRTHG